MILEDFGERLKVGVLPEYPFAFLRVQWFDLEVRGDRIADIIGELDSADF